MSAFCDRSRSRSCFGQHCFDSNSTGNKEEEEEEEEALMEYEKYDGQDSSQDDTDKQEPDDDDDPTCPPAWDIKPGPLSMNKALMACQAYHNMLQEVVREEGKKVSTVIKAIGNTTSLAQPWNTFQMQQWVLFPQAKASVYIQFKDTIKQELSDIKVMHQ
ncbi:hypothetical protein B0H17DRAFT_1131684 [Mycena rosella]|uniref:Uncharacterized protein n=1 Tax=Mycena rosella TaxID=1033263 RepID=A0AAD7GMW7_MYCRO|nr:hypothetical protein B0H17DRAFT_1131684 [Mycena rosella]